MEMLSKWFMVFLVVTTLAWAGQAAAGSADGSTYVLTAFDGDFSLVGLNDQGRSFQAVYGSTTRFKQAVLDKYSGVYPPCRDAASDYNNYFAINDTAGFGTAITDMVTNNCKAKVTLDKRNPVWRIKSFQPVP